MPDGLGNKCPKTNFLSSSRKGVPSTKAARDVLKMPVKYGMVTVWGWHDVAVRRSENHPRTAAPRLHHATQAKAWPFKKTNENLCWWAFCRIIKKKLLLLAFGNERAPDKAENLQLPEQALTSSQTKPHRVKNSYRTLVFIPPGFSVTHPCLRSTSSFATLRLEPLPQSCLMFERPSPVDER